MLCSAFQFESKISETFLRLRYGDAIWVAVTSGLKKIAAGDSVDVWLDVTELYLFDPAECLAACGDSVV